MKAQSLELNVQSHCLRQGFGRFIRRSIGASVGGPARRSLGVGGEAKGVVLLMVLWVVAILSVIVLEFCFAMRTEVNIANNYKEEFQLYAMAEGGVQRAITELIYKHDPRVQQMRKTMKLEEVPSDKKEWVMDGRPYPLPFDQGVCEVRVMSEAGKININLVSESTLRKIIGNFGLEEEEKDVVVDSILDWRDTDDFHRINGAENDYYQSLKEPYDCKNGNLDSIEELLLVRGMTPDLFYGKKTIKKEGEANKDRIGLKDIFSIYAAGEQIDINSATPVALRFVLGIPEEVAQQMVKAREEKGFDHSQDLLQRVPEISAFMGGIANLILFRSPVPYYTIESKAKKKEGESNRGIKAIVKIDQGDERKHKIIQWVDALI
jgi:general secretion pathway protein K